MVEVDEETGEIEIRDVVLVTDVGTIINPVAHQGQIDGGFMTGFGHALMEGMVAAEGKIANLSLGEYKLPAASDVPPFRAKHIRTSTGPGPFGAKMVGELSTAGVAPALANAVAAACGARVLDLPLTAERVLDALHGPGDVARATNV